jgi:hypothetical protein
MDKRVGADSVLYTAVVARVKADDLKGALPLYDAIQEPGYKSSAQMEIAMAQARMGDIATALSTAGVIQSSSTKGYALQEIAAVQAKAGDIDGALSWSSKLESPVEKSHALLGVAKGILARQHSQKSSPPITGGS